jgi:hypothetical protein
MPSQEYDLLIIPAPALTYSGFWSLNTFTIINIALKNKIKANNPTMARFRKDE